MMQNIHQIAILKIADRLEAKQVSIRYSEPEGFFFVTKNMDVKMMPAHRVNSHYVKVKMFYWFIVLVHT
ncbi:hypothetical protein TSO5_18370 [Azospirillum sp. TSO5]|nr:hypothetical protein TSO5_18370 [Azospirillum sp. TSO5]